MCGPTVTSTTCWAFLALPIRRQSSRHIAKKRASIIRYVGPPEESGDRPAAPDPGYREPNWWDVVADKHRGSAELQDVNKEPGAEDLFKKIGEAYEVSEAPLRRGRVLGAVNFAANANP